MEKINLRETYERIVKQFSLRNYLYFDTKDKLSRAANAYAVKMTTDAWRRQYANKSNR